MESADIVRGDRECEREVGKSTVLMKEGMEAGRCGYSE